MAKGQRLKPEQIVTLLRQIDVLTSNGKTLAQTQKKMPRMSRALFEFGGPGRNRPGLHDV